MIKTELTDRRALEEFVVDNDVLERIESRISAFNIFEAVGMKDQEIRHSHFLAFLFDPNQNHGLRDGFLKRFLSMTIRANPEKQAAISLIDIDVWDFDDAQVFRERDHIDIRISIPSHQLIVLIENKIYSGEHSDQLARYLAFAQSRFARWKLLPIFLTLSGAEATDSNYLQASYAQLASLVDDTARRTESTTGREVHALLMHYATMLRRHHLVDTELDELCARIYQRHKRALDLIFERRPDRYAELMNLTRGIVGETPGLYLATSGSKAYRAFNFDEWAEIGALHGVGPPNAGWCGLTLMICNENRLTIRLQITPVEQSKREEIWEFAKKAGAPLATRASLPANYATIYTFLLVDTDKTMDAEFSDIEVQVRQRWEQFVQTDLPKIRAAVNSAFGIIAPHDESPKVPL